MPQWVRVASTGDCPPGRCCEVVAEDRIVALCNVEGTFYALDGFCPHAGGPLGKGTLSGCTLTCPRHGLQFDVPTGGYEISRPEVHPTYPVKVEGDEVYLDVEAT